MDTHTCDDRWMSTTVQNGQSVDTYRCGICQRVRTEAADLPADD
jgi:hypothetical protein